MRQVLRLKTLHESGRNGSGKTTDPAPHAICGTTHGIWTVSELACLKLGVMYPKASVQSATRYIGVVATLPFLIEPGKKTSKGCLLLELLIFRLQSSKPALTSLKTSDSISTPMSYPKTLLIFYDHPVAVQLISPVQHPSQPL